MCSTLDVPSLKMKGTVSTIVSGMVVSFASVTKTREAADPRLCLMKQVIELWLPLDWFQTN
jgi:hypothetical protein